MTTGQLVILVSTIGLVIATYLFIRHWIKKDGIARLIFLVWTGTFIVFFGTRILIQTGRFTDWLTPAEAAQATVTNNSLLLVPLVATLLIELFYNFKDKE